jgi:hypothetical protein
MIWRRRRGDIPQRAAWAAAILVLAGLGAMAVCAAEPGKPASAADSSDKTDKGLLKKDEAFGLPKNWRNDDGTFNQAAIIAQQKKRLALINKELHFQMKMFETLHFLIFSNADDTTTHQFTLWGEALHANLCRQLSIAASERLWDGKCILLLFAAEAQFQEYAKTGDGIPADKAGAYFLWERREALNGDASLVPQLEHICIPTDNPKIPALQRLFAHEGTHAFLALYHKPVPLPLWLNEGLAEYMTVFNDATLRPSKIYAAKEYAASGKSLQSMFDEKTERLEAALYPVAYTFVECLLTQGGPKLRQLICNLKDGQKPDEALKAVYNVDTAGMEKTWREYMVRAQTSFKPAK